MPSTLAKSIARSKSIPSKRGVPTPEATDLLAWYERHARSLPWRIGPKERRLGVRPDPYRVFLSEVMLQQTTVKAVASYFRRFVERWPNVSDLADAADSDVMAAWAGLGYYARARNLIAAARTVAALPGAHFPENSGGLAALPGIGDYTSAAIAAIAFDECVPVVDGNVERVVARLFAIEASPPALKLAVRELLRPLVPRERAGEFAEALMDLGATICTPRKPACSLCPWCDPCMGRQQGRQAEFPLKVSKKPRPLRYGTAYVARRADGAILLRRRPPRGLLGGMSEPPSTIWQTEAPAPADPPIEASWVALALLVAHTFTHFELRLQVHRANVGNDASTPPGHWWAAAATFADEALPSVMKKAIEAAYPGATRRQPEKL